MATNPSAPVLARLLSRADRRSAAVADGYSSLVERWGLRPPYPLAPVFAQWDGLTTDGSAWMFAEPVNLAPEQNRLKLAPARLLDIAAEESVQLIDALNRHFSGEGISFFHREPGRWYVTCTPDEIPATTSADAARIDPLIECQPVSKGTINWRALQNEVQMLLHTHPVNQAREAAGKPVINGVWFWGGGFSPVLSKPHIDCLLADAPLALQLAKQTGIDTRPLNCSVLNELTGEVLVVLDEPANLIRDFDLRGWVRTIERLEKSWFEPLSTALSDGVIARLTIRTYFSGQEQVFTLTRRSLLLRFWRSTKTLSFYA